MTQLNAHNAMASLGRDRECGFGCFGMENIPARVQ